MRLYEVMLTEGRGLFARTPGDTFKNTELGITAKFVKVEVYPGVTQSKYDSAQERDTAVQEIEQTLSVPVDWVNVPKSNLLAFGIAEFELEDGTPMYWGRYFTEVRPVMTTAWPSSNVPPGWRYGAVSAEKVFKGFDPQTLIKDEMPYSAEQAIQRVQQNAPEGHEGVQLVNALNQITERTLPVFENMAEDITSLRDYFGEIMGPIALPYGLVSGEADAAKDEILGNVEWKDCRIMWPQSTTHELVDSYIISPTGERIGVSSKGNKGAKASSKNIQSSIDKAKKEQPDLYRTHTDTVRIMQIITENSALDGPLMLAKETGMIDDVMVERIKQFIREDKKDFEGLTEEEVALINKTKHRTDNPNFNVGFALLSVIAKQVCDGINEDGTFSEGAKAFMNQSSIIQLHTYASKSGNNVKVDRIESIYPPNFDGEIHLDSSKNYMSTRVHGKLTFVFQPSK